MENKNEKKIEITFSEKGEKMTTSSVLNKNLTVYEVVTALEALSSGLKSKIVEYVEINNITKDIENFNEIISKITIQDLQK